MKWRPVLLIVAAAALQACTDVARWNAQTTVADSLVTAAAREDWASVHSLTTGEEVVQRLSKMVSSEPALLRSAAKGLALAHGDLFTPDSAYVSFSFPYKGNTEVLDMRFVRSGGRWSVQYIALPKRI